MAKGHRIPKEKYREYLFSPKWRRKRAALFQHINGKYCERCLSGESIEVHHLHYGSLGKEDVGDIQALCGPCHFIEHENRPAASLENKTAFHQYLARLPEEDLRQRYPRQWVSLCKKRQPVAKKPRSAYQVLVEIERHDIVMTIEGLRFKLTKELAERLRADLESRLWTMNGTVFPKAPRKMLPGVTKVIKLPPFVLTPEHESRPCTDFRLPVYDNTDCPFDLV